MTVESEIAAAIRDNLKRRTFMADPATGLGGLGLSERDLAHVAMETLRFEWRKTRESIGRVYMDPVTKGHVLCVPVEEFEKFIGRAV